MLIDTVGKLIERLPTLRIYGTVQSIQGLIIKVQVSNNTLSVGSSCQISISESKVLLGEVVGFDQQHVLVMPYGSLDGIRPGSHVDFSMDHNVIFPTSNWLGRIIGGLGDPLDKLGFLPQGSTAIPLKRSPPPAHARQRISKRIDVGIKAINTFLTTCEGQRLGIFAGSGVGKSILMSMLARYTDSDVCVIGLIGERGREVREFIEDTLGEEGLKKSIMIVATSDEPPLLRRRAAYMTLAIAEYFRDQGKSVLCLMDSMTRLAMAQREIGLSAGEPPTTKGYTPSVFVELAQLMERAGPGVEQGMITAFFTVLVDGDDHNEPIADAVRGILDGHIVLDRGIAERGHYPAINILRSLSRTVPACHSNQEQKIIKRSRQILSTYEDMMDMIRLGAYKGGSNAEVDEAITLYPRLMNFLSQHYQEYVPLETSFQQLEKAIVE